MKTISFFKKHIKKTSILLLVLTLVLSPIITYARSIDEIQKEIESKKEQLTSLEDEVSTIEKDIEQQKLELENISGKRQKLAIQIDINKKEEQLIQKQLEDLEEKHAITLLEQERRITTQNNIMADFYLGWKQTNIIKELLNSESESIVKVAIYQSAIATDEQDNIETLEQELNSIREELEISATQKQAYVDRLAALSAQISEIENELGQLDSKIASNTNNISSYRTQAGELQTDIEKLTAEQKAIQEYENSLLLGPADNGGTKEIQTGELYFQGRGRELYQGHGIGMSQFGALGAAVQGWDYKKILEFYYPGAKVVEYTSTKSITVDGFGSMSLQDYAAGAGEVPDYSCEDLDIEFDPNNLWQCWPKEAIKAQIIAFKSYGLASTKGGNSICATAHCQVYKGGDNKMWAADETKDMVIIYDGEPITAYYSSDNHNGYGPGNIDTIWSNFEGIGTPSPYLKAVNDSAFTFKYSYTDWMYRTNGYTANDLNELLDWSTTSSKASGSYKNFLLGIKTNIGSIESIELEHGPSGRVKRVKLNGDKGSRYMAGWLFKSVWNIWISNAQPTGEEDYIYSLTYYLKVK